MPHLTPPAPASPADYDAVVGLLSALALPHADLTPEHLRTFLVVREGGQIVATGGLEVYPDGGLLRSLAVDPALQGTGLGHRLVEAIEEAARLEGLPALYLLTTTAEGFFARLGWQPIPRHEVPEGVRASSEFAALCPASAACLTKPLR